VAVRGGDVAQAATRDIVSSNAGQVMVTRRSLTTLDEPPSIRHEETTTDASGRRPTRERVG
jgi:hypothetical protein